MSAIDVAKPYERYVQGVICAKLGKWDEAITWLTAASRGTPVEPDIVLGDLHMNLVEAHYGRRNWQEVVDAATTALATLSGDDPNRPKIQYTMGTALMMLGRFREASRAFESVVDDSGPPVPVGSEMASLSHLAREMLSMLESGQGPRMREAMAGPPPGEGLKPSSPNDWTPPPRSRDRPHREKRAPFPSSELPAFVMYFLLGSSPGCFLVPLLLGAMAAAYFLARDSFSAITGGGCALVLLIAVVAFVRRSGRAWDLFWLMWLQRGRDLIKLKAIRLLGERRAEWAIDDLLMAWTAARGPSMAMEMLRSQAATALEDIGGPLVTSGFAMLAEDPSSATRAITARALAGTADPEGRRILGLLTNDSEPLVRELAMKGRQQDLFVSYRTTDVQTVRPVVERLMSQGVRVWFGEYRMLLENYQNFNAAIQEGIRDSRFAVLFTSPAYGESDHCKNEVSWIRESFADRASERVMEVRLRRWDAAAASDALGPLRPLETVQAHETGTDPIELANVIAARFGFQSGEPSSPARTDRLVSVADRGVSFNAGDFEPGRPSKGPEGQADLLSLSGPDGDMEVICTTNFQGFQRVPEIDLNEPESRKPYHQLRMTTAGWLQWVRLQTNWRVRVVGLHLVRWHERGQFATTSYVMVPGAGSRWMRQYRLVFRDLRADRDTLLQYTFTVEGSFREFLARVPRFDTLVMSTSVDGR
jgi:hypothetical protein